MKYKLDKYILSIQIAVGAVIDNKVRSVLTALGIIFGVAAVIAMLAIGNGAKKEVLDQMKLVGVNNIVITPSSDTENIGDDSSDEDANSEEAKSKQKLSRGLTLSEAYSIKNVIPSVERVSPEVSNKTRIIYSGKGVKGTFTGITSDYFNIYSLELEKGSFFNSYQYENAKQVCIIGHNIKSRLFPTEDALGKQIKCGDIWLTIIGVLKSHGASTGQMAELKMGDFNMNVYAPIETVLLRFNDRSIVTKKSLKGRGRNSSSSEEKNRNQLDKIVVQVKETEQLRSTAVVLNKMLLRRHSGARDFEITVPELLLKQEQKTRSIFNLVLGAIASISLIVGGIGIMNIMLASVMERIREIGVRRAIGATQSDIVFQFLSEAILISVAGGIIGIILGVVIAQVITRFTEIPTIISAFSIIISFGVSAGIGVLFGYMPAKKAAVNDPVTSLRHE
ncbi:MAG: FtsX-like permease family protein [Bacteroidales bacterium]|nr:FtsX-like permease family protein [Bacteroidales bacterium]